MRRKPRLNGVWRRVAINRVYKLRKLLNCGHPNLDGQQTFFSIYFTKNPNTLQKGIQKRCLVLWPFTLLNWNVVRVTRNVFLNLYYAIIKLRGPSPKNGRRIFF
jgi:hypothetical protein